MPQYILDGENMTTIERTYDELEHVFHLPDYFGRNLDAFEECLSDLTEEEGVVSVVIKNTNVVEGVLSEWGDLEALFLGNPHVSLVEE